MHWKGWAARDSGLVALASAQLDDMKASGRMRRRLLLFSRTLVGATICIYDDVHILKVGGGVVCGALRRFCQKVTYRENHEGREMIGITGELWLLLIQTFSIV